ncbi:MAG: tetratricopeptide repeat protein [Cyanobacteria bacterium SID2]|nr:tetratricopeptide repeat protein [Cyanobacteria bacterium SID2]
MSVPIASTPTQLAVSGVATPESSHWNRHVYQRLKLAFALGLRRQVFLAVCDDTARSSLLAAQLQSELRQRTYLLSLQLDLNPLDPLAQIRRALPNGNENRPVGLQILGISALTRQSANAQWSFLKHLRDIPAHLCELDISLIFWIPRPWLHVIQHSAPEFWQHCTGVFEFHGEPNGQISEIQPTSSPPRKPPKRIPPPPVWKHIDAALVRSILATRNEFDSLDPVSLLLPIDRLHTSKATPSQIADRYHHLGNLYRDSAPHRYRERLHGDSPSPSCARVAIQLYRRAVQLWQLAPNADSARHLATLNDIGTLYWMLSRAQPPEVKQRDLEASLEAYQDALSQLDPQTQPQIWATIQHNVGSVYADLGRVRQRPQEWQQSIEAFEAALYVHPQDADPQQYAAIQNNLGTAYWSLAQYGDAATHLNCAIAAYAAALNYYTPDRDELNYAMLQNNIGTAYWALSQQADAPECLHLAVVAYREALRYRTADRVPTGCAATQNNLGTAYWHLAQQTADLKEAQAYLERSIEAYDAAIEVSQSLQSLTFDLVATYNNVGLAHYHLALKVERSSALFHLNAALHHHLQAYEGWKKQIDRAKAALDSIVRTIRSAYEIGGIEGQSKAFSLLPPSLLSDVMQKL